MGTPVDGVRVTLEPPAGTEGLVVVESASVASSYVPEFDLRLADGRFETSDVATWQGGELALRRRADRVINLRGRKVDPSEIERVLASLGRVDEAVVVGVVSTGRRRDHQGRGGVRGRPPATISGSRPGAAANSPITRFRAA